MAKGLKIVVPNADFEASAVGFAAVAADKLEGLYFLNGSPERAARNLAKVNRQAAVIGSPVVNNGFLQFKGATNYLQTDVEETKEFTMIAVAKTPSTLADDANRPMYISNNGSPVAPGYIGTFGSALYPSSPTDIRQTGSRTTTDGTTPTSGGTTIANYTYHNQWSFLVGRIRENEQRLDDKTHGLSNAQATAGARQLASGRFRIGSGFSTAFAGLADMAFVAIYSKFITDAERDALYNQIRPYLSRKFGINV